MRRSGLAIPLGGTGVVEPNPDASDVAKAIASSAWARPVLRLEVVQGATRRTRASGLDVERRRHGRGRRSGACAEAVI